MRSLLLAVSLLSALSGLGAEIRVADPEAARKATRDARPGDVIVLAPGEWKDADLRLDGEGTEDAPITIRAESPGATVFTGASRVRLGGAHLVVSGLLFRNLGGAKADWLEFRIDSKRRASHCRVTGCVFVETPEFTSPEAENRWIGLYGEGNWIDGCTILGKKNKGATLVVWLGEEDAGAHRILSNKFGERPRLGRNGGETIRIGDSKTSMMEAKCLIEGNLFHRCDGETECVSNKSCGNVYRNNDFVETQGTLTLRHGNGCLVEGNRFHGMGRAQTGGIRVIGEGHRIVGNDLRGLEGNSFRAALCLVNGIPDSPENGYHQVKDVVIEGNTVFDCKAPLVIGYNDEKAAVLPPRGVRIVNNRIQARAGRPAVRAEMAPDGIVWDGNSIRGEWVGLGRVEAEGEILAGVPELSEMPNFEEFGAIWWMAGR